MFIIICFEQIWLEYDYVRSMKCVRSSERCIVLYSKCVSWTYLTAAEEITVIPSLAHTPQQALIPISMFTQSYATMHTNI